MNKTKFKVGDKILGIGGDIVGCEAIITKVENGNYVLKLTKIGNREWQKDWKVGRIEDRGTNWGGCIILVGDIKPIKFILKICGDTSEPTAETFETLIDVKDRLKEMKDEEVQLFEIKKELSVNVTERIVVTIK